MLWREATARLTRETTPCNHLPPKHRAGDGARSFYTSPTAMLHHPFKNNPLSRCTVLCCSTKADSLLRLAHDMDKGSPPEIPQPHGAAGPCSSGEGRRLWRDRSALTWWGYGRGGKAGQVPARGLPQHLVQLPNTHPRGCCSSY